MPIRRFLKPILISLEFTLASKISKISKNTKMDNMSENLEHVNKEPKSLNEYVNPLSH